MLLTAIIISAIAIYIVDSKFHFNLGYGKMAIGTVLGTVVIMKSINIIDKLLTIASIDQTMNAIAKTAIGLIVSNNFILTPLAAIVTVISAVLIIIGAIIAIVSGLAYGMITLVRLPLFLLVGVVISKLLELTLGLVLSTSQVFWGVVLVILVIEFIKFVASIELSLAMNKEWTTKNERTTIK